MPIFFYNAKNEAGVDKSGTLEASNKHEVVSILRGKGFILTHIESLEKIEKKDSNIFKIVKKFSRVSLIEKILFARHLSLMINAGMSLDKSLLTLSEQTASARFKKIILNIEEGIRKGESFAHCLDKYPKVFPNLFVNMVKVGETSGTLEEVLNLLADQMKKSYDITSRVRGAMIYPAVILGVMVVVGFAMMILVVPKLAAIFEELKVELPLSTRMLVETGYFLRDYWYVAFLGAVIISFFISFFYKHLKPFSNFVHWLFVRLPIFGLIIKKLNSARMARNLGSLIKAGVPIVEALRITKGTLGNFYFKESLDECATKIKGGAQLSDVLGEYKNLYPPMVVQMIKVGEETGNLSEILGQIADFYEEEVTNITKNLASLIEPALMVLVGAAVGFFAISMIQPMYTMMSAL